MFTASNEYEHLPGCDVVCVIVRYVFISRSQSVIVELMVKIYMGAFVRLFIEVE